MKQQGAYRHELKYQIRLTDYFALRQKLRAIMKPDSHAGVNGQYKVRSIYFDNVSDKALREKVDGVAKMGKIPPSLL